MRIIIFIILLIFSLTCLGQVTANFDLPMEVCLDEQFELNNTSINANEYEWDFCPNDITQQPLTTTSISNLPNVWGYKIIKSGINIYVFLLSGNNLYRLEFDSSFTNLISTTNLGDFGLINNPDGLDIYKDSSGDWVGFIGHRNNGGGYIIRLVWSDLVQQPTAESIGNLGQSGRIRDVKIIKDGANYFGVFPYYNSPLLIRANFGTSLKNVLEATDITNSSPLPNVQFAIGLDIINQSGEWKVGLSSLLTKTISLYSLGTDITNAPTEIKSQTFPSLQSVLKFKFYKNYNGDFYGFWSTLGKIRIINLKDLTPSSNFELLSTDLPESIGIDYLEEKGAITLINGNISQNLSYFNSECLNNNLPSFSEESEPITYFSSPGTYPISLTATHSNGGQASITKEITVTNNVAPEGEIMLEPAYCILDNISFNFITTANIATYNWDFGDGNTSNSISPSHQYNAEGTYFISLSMESIEGCKNTFYDTLNIIPDPQPEFTTTQTEYCTFESIAFTNTTFSADYGENVSWLWDFNGEGVSTIENPNFSFSTAGSKTITLEVNVLGCINTFSTSIEIIEGPFVSFEYDKNCLDQEIQFTNLSTGTNITEYEWDFGNGQTSTLENPQNIYNTTGNFTVSLTVSNSSGCVNTITKDLIILSQVIDSINVTTAIENLPFDLEIDWNNNFDSTQIQSYQWEIEGELQTTNTASYTLPQGQYNMNLEVTSALGCTFNFQRIIEVQASEKPIPDFNLPIEVCLDEQFELDNISINGNEYEWDFCPNDITQQPLTTTSISNLPNVWGYKIIKSEINIFVFLLSGNNLYRLEFDSSFTNLISTTNLGDFGLINNPDGLDIYQDSSGDWVGFIGHRNNGGGYIIRLVWTDLVQQPTAESIGNLGQPGRIRDVKIIKDGDNYFGVFPYYNSPLLIRANFGTSLKNVLEATDITNSSPLPNVQFAIGMDIINQSGEWKVGLSSLLTNTISLFSIGTDITNEPSEIKSQSFPSLQSVLKFKFYKNYNGDFYGFWSTQDQIKVINLKDMTSTSNFELLSTDLPESIGIDYLEEKGAITLINGNISQNLSYFKSECLNNNLPTFSEESEPIIYFSAPGTYPITLTATHPNGSQASITKEITVTNNVAPELSINNETEACIGNPINFEASSPEAISNWKWKFGNGDSSIVQAPAYSFDNPGTYQVTLEGQSANGCSNLAIQEITIYEPPIVSFDKSTQGTLCSQKPIDFINTTILPTTASFNWDFGDGNVSTEENPTHTFASAGEYTVTLNIEMAGCTSIKVETVQVNPGPEVAFQTTDLCYGQIINFSNNSAGEFITGYQWNFGDGTTSTLLNPSHQFDAPGEKTILLTAYTSNGCTYTIERTIEVFPLASVDFEAEPACSNRAVQFSELVSIQNANVSNYFWDFGLSGSTTDISTEANPSFTYPNAGTFEVRLAVTTEDGCVTSNTKQVIVNEIPNPTISYQANCIGEPFQFTGNPNSSITNEFWQLTNEQNNTLASSTSSTFSYNFLESGTYTISYRQQTAQLCSKTVTQLIEVVEKPIAAFTFNNACVGETVHFENNTVLNGNTASDYSWFINNQLVSDLPKLDYQFENAGTYEVSLQLTTTNSCMATFTDEITISDIPTPDFDLEQDIGAAPFTLNTSTELEAGETANWYINGQLLSSGASFNSTLDSIGIYLIGLEMSNESGCTQTVNRQLDIRKPILDISATRLQAVKRADYTEFILTLGNNGSLVPDYYNINFSLGDYAISERLDATILPGTSVNERLSIQLSTDQLNGVDRVCLEIEPIISPFEELSIADNRVCVGVSSTFNVMNIFPNPSANNVTIPLILPKAGMVEVVIEQSNGQTAVKQSYSELSVGYNELTLKRNGLEAGIYFLRIRYEGQEKIKKIVFY